MGVAWRTDAREVGARPRINFLNIGLGSSAEGEAGEA